MKLRFTSMGSAGDWAVAEPGEKGAYLGRIVRYGRQWDCWYGAEGVLLSQGHPNRRSAAEALVVERAKRISEGRHT